jgi:Nitrate and nitrite sensing
MAQRERVPAGGGGSPGGLPPPPPPPSPPAGAGSPWPLVLITLASAMAAVVLVGGVIAQLVLTDRVTGDEDQGRERAAATEVPEVSDDLVQALQDERALAALDLVGLGDALLAEALVPDTPSAREATDAALSDFDAVLVDADPAGRSHYQAAVDALDGLTGLRSEADAAMPGATVENMPTSVQVSDRYGEIIEALLDGNDSLILTIDDPELRRGLGLLSQAQRQVGTVGQVILRLLPVTSTAALTPESVTDLASVTAELEAGRTEVMERAAGTVYETAADQLDEELDAAGLQQVLETALATGQPDLAQALPAVTEASFAWRTFARSVDDTLRAVTS